MTANAQQLGPVGIPIYSTTAQLALEQGQIVAGAICATQTPFALYTAVQGSAPTDGQYVQCTSAALYGSVVTYWKQSQGIQRISTTFNLAALQALTSGTAFNVGAALPTNFRMVDAEIVVNTALAGNTSDTITLQGGSDSAGSIIASSNVFTGGLAVCAAPGSNPYASRGGQQIKATITGGSALSGLSAGSLTFNIYGTELI